MGERQPTGPRTKAVVPPGRRTKAGLDLRRVVLPALLMGTGLAALVALVSSLGWIRPVELAGYDLLVRLRGPAPVVDDIVIVDFDDATVRERQAFPLPRRLLASVLKRVSEGGASVVGLDVILDFSRSSLGDDDAALASAIREAGNVVLVAYMALDGGTPGIPLPLFHQAGPLGLAFCDTPEDEDGYVRRTFLLASGPIDEDQDGSADLMPAFPVAVASAFSNQSLTPSRPGTHRFGDHDVPLATTTPYDTALIDFTNSAPAPIVPVRELLAPSFDPSIFRGKIVMIGQSSVYGGDRKNTPVFRFDQGKPGWRLLSGAEVQAAAIETLLRGRTIRPFPQGRFWAGLAIVLVGMIALILSLRPAPGIISALVLGAGVFGAAVALFTSQRVWLPYMTAEIGLGIALPSGLGYRFVQERRLKAAAEAARREMMVLFGKYVSPEVAEEIWQRRSEIVLAGEERIATVLFSDIRSFTALTAGKPSAEVLSWLNQYFSEMAAVVKENRGFLNKFIGDGLMVLFGVPLSDGAAEDAARALRASIQMLERVERLNASRQPGVPELKIGIGLHTGSLTAGSVGSADRLEYSVIGETVNLASRLESLTKELHAPIVMSAGTERLVRGRFETVPLGECQVRGFEGKMVFFTAAQELPAEVRS